MDYRFVRVLSLVVDSQRASNTTRPGHACYIRLHSGDPDEVRKNLQRLDDVLEYVGDCDLMVKEINDNPDVYIHPHSDGWQDLSIDEKIKTLSMELVFIETKQRWITGQIQRLRMEQVWENKDEV